MVMTEKEILTKISDYMAKNNLRQYQLAKKIGVPEATLNRWLNKKASISNAYLKILKSEEII